MAKAKTWRGAVSIGGHCAECREPEPVLFDADGQPYCRACVLAQHTAVAVSDRGDTLHTLAQNITTIDRRGDELFRRVEIAREMDAQAAIALHLAIKARTKNAERYPGINYGPPLESPPLPDSYSHVLAVLGKLTQADDEFAATITELRERYETAAYFGPKQMLLVQWRLTKYGVPHEPAQFVVSTRTDKEIEQLRSLDNWRKKKIAPYLSWSQRARFGF